MLWLCLFYNPMDYTPLGSTIHGVFQAGILEWVVISFPRGSSQPRGQTHVSCTGTRTLPLSHQAELKRDEGPSQKEMVWKIMVYFHQVQSMCHQFSSVQLLSRVRLFATPWTAARQTSLSITNSRSPPESMSINSVMPSNHLLLCHPLLLYVIKNN